METEDGIVYQKRGQPLGTGLVDLHSHLPHNLNHGLPGSHLGVYGLDRRWWKWIEDYSRR
jgi:cytosine/adenosine deaminase-related metal-dependent hydrolase